MLQKNTQKEQVGAPCKRWLEALVITDWSCRYTPYASVLGRLGKRVETEKSDAEHSMTGKGDWCRSTLCSSGRQRKAPKNKAELPETQVLKVLPFTITHRCWTSVISESMMGYPTYPLCVRQNIIDLSDLPCTAGIKGTLKVLNLWITENTGLAKLVKGKVV